MTQTVQYIIVIAVIVVAVVWVLWRGWRIIKPKDPDCDGSPTCSCCSIKKVCSKRH